MANAMTSASQRLARSRGFRAVVAGARKLAGKAPIPEKKITVMTYNILAQKYVQNGMHQYCKPQHLQWRYRRARLLGEIESYGTDLICLQEVEAGVFSRELQPWLALRGYQGHYLARQNETNAQGPPEGIALFYRTEIFELLQHQAVTFTEAPTAAHAPASALATTTTMSTSGSDMEEEELTNTRPLSTSTTYPPSSSPLSSSATAETAMVGEVGLYSATQTTPGHHARATHATTSTSYSSCSFSSLSSWEGESETARQEGGKIAAAGGSSVSNSGDTATGRNVRGNSSGRGLGNNTNSNNTLIGGGSSGSGKQAAAHRVKGSRNVVVTAFGTAGSTATATERAGGGASTSGRSAAGVTGGSGNSNSNGATRGSSGGSSSAGFWSVFRRRQDGAIMALLRHRPSQRLVLVAVTHLFWNPAYPDVKAFQAALLCQEMASFLATHSMCPPGEVPVVLAGDFNSTCRKHIPDAFDPKIPPGPDGLVSGVYSLLTGGWLPPTHPDHPAARRRLRAGEVGDRAIPERPLDSAGLSLASAYCMALGREPALTTRTETFAACLDYIFVSPQHFDVVRTLELPYEDPGQNLPYRAVRNPLNDIDFPAIPDAVFPSDHLALAAELQLNV